MSTWANRIKSRMKELDMTQEELAGKLGITRGAITHYLAGRRVPPLRKFNELARALKTDASWLQFGVTQQSTPRKASNKKTERYRSIPILTWLEAAKNPDVSELTQKDIKDSIPHLFTDKLHWYALRIKGDSMTSSSEGKSFYEGDLIIIDPDKTPEHGDFVIAVIGKSKEATFKQYVVDGGLKYLKPLNKQYSAITIDKTTRILGAATKDLSL